MTQRGFFLNSLFQVFHSTLQVCIKMTSHLRPASPHPGAHRESPLSNTFKIREKGQKSVFLSLHCTTPNVFPILVGVFLSCSLEQDSSVAA